MPMFDLISIFAAALLLVALAATSRQTIRERLARPRFWISVAVLASILSLASALYSSRRHSGTGWQTSFGGPKPWYGRWESFEGGSGSSGASLLHFVGNTLFYAAVLLAIWLLWSLAADVWRSTHRSED